MNPGPFIIIKLERKLKWWLESLFDLQQRDANDAFLGTAGGHGTRGFPERLPLRERPRQTGFLPLGSLGLPLSAAGGSLSSVGSQVRFWGAMGMTKGIVKSFVAK